MKARNLAWWAASPSAYATVQLARQSGCRVLTGPFVGMRYPASFVPRLLFHGPYQVGSFEHELHPAIGEIADSRPATVVNVGSAEGYYSVGMAVCRGHRWSPTRSTSGCRPRRGGWPSRTALARGLRRAASARLPSWQASSPGRAPGAPP